MTGAEDSGSDWIARAPDNDPDRPLAIAWDDYERDVTTKWAKLLESDPEEPKVQEFLELHPAMVPGGSGDIGPGGHHGSEMGALFRQPRLKGEGRDFVPDFLWITRSTTLITPIVIEIEKPSKRWFQKSGRPTAHLRDAHDQLSDWRTWFEREQNRAIFRSTFLFDDRYADRQLEPHFVLIYGRASEFAPGGGHDHPSLVSRKRDSRRHTDESFMTFDSLRPNFNHKSSLTLSLEHGQPTLHAFSPMFGTTTGIGPTALRLGNPSDALARTVMMTASRKEYLRDRWQHWAEVEMKDVRFGRNGPRQLGFE